MYYYQSGSLAQLVEQLAFNQLVAGSNPARPTNFPCFPIPFVLRGDTGSSLNFEWSVGKIPFKGTISIEDHRADYCVAE